MITELISNISSKLPIFIALILILSYVFWAKFFSEEENLKPKKSKDLITILLISASFFINLFSGIFIFIYSIQNYSWNADVKSTLFISEIIFLIIFFVYVYSIASNNKKEIKLIFKEIRAFFLASFSVSAISLVVFNFIIESNLKRFLLILFVLSIYIFILYLLFNPITNKILEINHKIKFRTIEFSPDWKSFWIFIFLLVGIFIIFVPNMAAFTKKTETNYTGYVVLNDYSQKQPWAYKQIEIYYYTYVGKNAKRIVLNLDNEKIDLDKEAQNYFEIYINKNGTFFKVADFGQIGKEINSNNIRMVTLIKNKLFIDFNSEFLNDDFDGFIIKGAIKENISKDYSITPEDSYRKGSLNEETNLLKIDFNINSSLNYPSTQNDVWVTFFREHDKKSSECEFDSMVLTLTNATCNLGRGICSGDSCNTNCDNWRLALFKDDNGIYFRSDNDREKGVLEVKSFLICKD